MRLLAIFALLCTIHPNTGQTESKGITRRLYKQTSNLTRIIQTSQDVQRRLNAENRPHLGEQRAISENTVENCDAAFITCLGDSKCGDCFLELQTKDINWAQVTSDTSCESVLKLIYERGHCQYMKNKHASERNFCNTYNACVQFEDENDNDDNDNNNNNDTPKKKDKIDCSLLTECKWDGFHESFLGDGICHDELDGCYNTKICGFDGGDCCEDTCSTQSSYVDCGVEGYRCRDPNSSMCDPELSINCDPDKIKPDENGPNPAAIDCGPTTSLYRLVMYDSFGDGWDETQMEINAPDGSNVFKGGLKNGSEGTEYVCLSREPTCYDVSVKGGVWGNECSWEIRAYGTGTPAIAGGGAPMECNFCVAGGDKNGKQTTCDGKPNIDPSNDPEYKEFKDLYNCMQNKCPIQMGTCQEDSICKKCFGDDTYDYCFANDQFNAVVDCTLCECTEQKDNDFCSKKGTPGAVIPNEDNSSGYSKSCTPSQTLKGSDAVMTFHTCTDFDATSMMVTEFSNSNFGELDRFESCAHSFNDSKNHGGHTALECMQILVDTMNGKSKDANADAPHDAIQSLAKLLYSDGEKFCDCSKDASAMCPLCDGFMNFKTLLYESMDACKALDEIDCDAWSEFVGPCRSNLEKSFKKVDFSSKDQCQYVHDTCGGAGPFPAFRRLDCQDEIDKGSWDFYRDFSRHCNGDSGDDFRPSPPVPSPTTSPVTSPPTTPSSPTDDDENKPSDGSGKKYIPPEERGKEKKKKNREKGSADGGSHWFRKMVFLGLFVGGGYYYYKRQADGFSFNRYRRMNQRFDDSMYSGLALESSTTFEPPSLPPRPDAVTADYSYYS